MADDEEIDLSSLPDDELVKQMHDDPAHRRPRGPSGRPRRTHARPRSLPHPHDGTLRGPLGGIQATAPRQFTQYARNPANNVEIGGMDTVLAPAYGSPFVLDIDQGRRYGTIDDFRNFVKLAYMSPYLHPSGGTVLSRSTCP
jgi:trimethylamine methyltransferase MttB